MAVALIIGFATLSALLIAEPKALSGSAKLGLLGVLVPAAIAVSRASPLARGAGHFFAPLVLFTLAFVAVLLPRAASLAVGNEGRFFVVDGRSGDAVPLISARLADDHPERRGTVAPNLETNAEGGWSLSQPRVGRTSSSAFVGEASYRVRFRMGPDATYVALPLPGPLSDLVPVAPGVRMSASIAFLSLRGPGEDPVQLYVRYLDRGGAYLTDRMVADAPRPVPRREWQRISGTTVAPPGARLAQPVLLIRPSQPNTVHVLLVDAPLLVPGTEDAASFTPLSGAPRPWAAAFDVALAGAAAFVLMTFIGYLLPWPRRSFLSTRIQLADLRAPRTRRLASVALAVGIAAYVFEMWTYGGYGGYLASLKEAGVSELGRWYLRALALLPTGAGVFVFASCVAQRRRPAGWLEFALIAVGAAIPLSYLLKTALVLPLLQVLLFGYFVRRRGGVLLATAALGTALLTPLVYVIRFEGLHGIGALFTIQYWRDFHGSFLSRFFHFESYMTAVPYSSSEPPWQPVVDFFATAVPRALWDEKPLSPATRFTHDHLVHGLHTGTDIGVISLPGELWILGGGAGIVVGGLLVGIALRLAHKLILDRTQPGTMLVGVGMLTWLVFLVDGWGVASATVHALISSAGWLLFLRLKDRGTETFFGADGKHRLPA